MLTREASVQCSVCNMGECTKLDCIGSKRLLSRPGMGWLGRCLHISADQCHARKDICSLQEGRHTTAKAFLKLTISSINQNSWLMRQVLIT